MVEIAQRAAQACLRHAIMSRSSPPRPNCPGKACSLFCSVDWFYGSRFASQTLTCLTVLTRGAGHSTRFSALMVVWARFKELVFCVMVCNINKPVVL